VDAWLLALALLVGASYPLIYGWWVLPRLVALRDEARLAHYRVPFSLYVWLGMCLGNAPLVLVWWVATACYARARALLAPSDG
jgi:hypothetical protein